MIYLLLNIFLAFLWLILTLRFTVDEFVFGYVLGYLVIWFTHRNIRKKPKYVTILPKLASFLALFVREVVNGSLRIASDILSPRPRIRPGIIALPLDAQTDLEITTLAGILTLTPGTTSMAISSDKSVLYLYTVYIDGDEQETIKHIKKGLEKKLLEVLR